MPQRSSVYSANHPKVKYLRQRLNHTIQLSVEKAAAHLKSPGQYPLPADKETLEYAIVDLLKELPKRKQDKFVERMKEAVNATAATRQQKYGSLSAVDFHKSTAVANQVMALPVPENMKITEADLPQLKLPVKPSSKTKAAARPVAGGRQPRQAVAGTTLQFAVENITCVETLDARKDEISISAFVIDSSGVQQDRNDFFSADFKKGQSKSPGAAGNLFNISLGDSTGGVFPASFAAGVLLVEKGLFRGGDSAEKIGSIMRIIGKVIATGSLVTIFIPAAGLPLGLAIVGVGAVILLIGDVLFFGGDQISNIGADELLLETPPLVGENFARTLDIVFEEDGFILGGKYSVATRWSVI